MKKTPVDDYREALIDMVYQFAYWDDNKGGFSTSGLGALEYAFEVLEWDDPHICEKAQCDEPNCKKHATCGFPIDGGYRRTCGNHFQY